MSDGYPSISKLTAILAEYNYITSLPEKEAKLYWLICRYEGKVSPRLLDIKRALYEDGKAAYGEVFRTILKDASRSLEKAFALQVETVKQAYPYTAYKIFSIDS